MEQAGHLDEHRGYANTYLIALDGVYYFSSQTLHCENCTVHQCGGQTYYFHSALTPVLVAPQNNRVYALEPEFIQPQDGSGKQECEQNIKTLTDS